MEFFDRLKLAKLLDDRGDRVLFFRIDDATALEFVWINIANELAQRVEMLASRECLIVFFDEGYRHKKRDYTDIS